MDTFFTWCMPGIPISANDLDFCSKGIYSAPTAEEMKTRLQHAFDLSMRMDFLPDPDAPYSNERQEGMYKPDAEKRLSEMYRQILRFSKVVHQELSDKEKEKLEKYRSLLFTTRTVKDLATDEEKQVTEEGPVLKAYNEKMASYVTAAMEYNAKRVSAAAAAGPEGRAAVADWSMNQQLYFLKVKATADAWTAGGYRNEVDQMNAFINQTTERSLTLWKQQLEEAYDKAVLTSTEVPIPFPYITLVPGDILSSGGWTGINVSHDSVEWSKHNEERSWKGGGGLNLGIRKIGGAASGSSAKETKHVEVNSFSLTLELAQALIVRAGFYPEWFSCRGWKLSDGWTFSDPPSDGGDPPKGEFIGYATQALFVRNVEIHSKEFVSAYESARKEWGADANVGWGPLSLSGSYRRSSKDEKFESESKGEKLSVKGAQIVGFVNHLLGKCPNPLPELKDADFLEADSSGNGSR